MSTYPSLTERLNLFMQGAIDRGGRATARSAALREIAVRELNMTRYMAPLRKRNYDP